jgi:predicted negative regulator of RcsB-dependent stress response
MPGRSPGNSQIGASRPSDGGAPYMPITKPKGAKKPIAYMTMREKQEFLKSLGYAIDIDGIFGPQTSGAWKNYVKAKDPKKAAAYWSSNSKLSNAFSMPDSPTKTTPAGNPVPDAGGSGSSGSSTTDAPKGTSGSAVRVKPVNLQAQIAALMRNMVNPKQYMSMFDQQVNPAMEALQAEISRRETRGPSAIDDNLKQWYEQLIAKNNEGAGATSAAAERIMGAHNAGTQGVVNVLGGSASPAAASAGAYGATASGELGSLAMAQDAFESNSGKDLALQGLQERLAARQEGTDALDDLRLKMIELQGSTGQNKAQAWLDALKLRDDQVGNIADLKSLQAMAAADAMAKGQGLTAGSLANKRSALQYDIDALKLALGMKNMKQGAVTPWDQLDPGKLQGLRKELLGGAINDQNQLLYDPMTTMNTWGSTLRGLSQGQWNPFNNPKIDRWRDDLLKSLIPGWNKTHKKNKWSFNKNGKLVRIK